jgi:hypothetical protein
MPITVYVTNIEVTYDLLLLQRWMKGVEAQKDYKNKRFSINYQGSKKTIRLTFTRILRRGQLLEELDYNCRLRHKANILEELEEE